MEDGVSWHDLCLLYVATPPLAGWPGPVHMAGGQGPRPSERAPDSLSPGLELAHCHFGHTLQVKASSQPSPDSRGGEETSPLDERILVTLRGAWGQGGGQRQRFVQMITISWSPAPLNEARPVGATGEGKAWLCPRENKECGFWREKGCESGVEEARRSLHADIDGLSPYVYPWSRMSGLGKLSSEGQRVTLGWPLSP